MKGDGRISLSNEMEKEAYREGETNKNNYK